MNIRIQQLEGVGGYKPIARLQKEIFLQTSGISFFLSVQHIYNIYYMEQ